MAEMNEYKLGTIVKSRAGHDKDSFFVIVKAENEYVYLADGRLRLVERPKKKKKLHIVCTKHICVELIQKLEETGTIKNEDVKYELKRYCTAGLIEGGRLDV